MPEKEQAQARPESILCFEDGLLRWGYEDNLWKNAPLALKLLYISFSVAIVLALVVFFATLGDGFAVAATNAGSFLVNMGLWFTVFNFVLMYLIYVPLIRRGGAAYAFEMDEDGVTFLPMKKGSRLRDALNLLRDRAGEPMDDPRERPRAEKSQFTAFSTVTVLLERPKQHCLILRSGMVENIVYADKDQYAFVSAYIHKRMPNGARLIKH